MRVVTIEDLIRGSERRLGLDLVGMSSGLKRCTCQVRVQFLDEDPGAELLPGVILIISAIMYSQWASTSRAAQKFALEKIMAAHIPAVFLSEAPQSPKGLERLLEENGISCFASAYDDFLLESRLKGLLREKIDQISMMHGVLLNILGQGVLIKGDSGIGKTTLAIELAHRGYLWVADDAIEIEKKSGNRLWARGCHQVRHLLDMKTLGIRKAEDVIDRENMQDETMLHLVLEGVIMRKEPTSGSLNKTETCDIMGLKVPYVAVPITDGEAMDASGIEKIIQTFLQQA